MPTIMRTVIYAGMFPSAPHMTHLQIETKRPAKGIHHHLITRHLLKMWAEKKDNTIVISLWITTYCRTSFPIGLEPLSGYVPVAFKTAILFFCISDLASLRATFGAGAPYLSRKKTWGTKGQFWDFANPFWKTQLAANGVREFGVMVIEVVHAASPQ